MAIQIDENLLNKAHLPLKSQILENMALFYGIKVNEYFLSTKSVKLQVVQF